MKEVQDVFYKFYLTLEDANDDFNRAMVAVPTEGSIQPNEATAMIDISTKKIVTEDYVSVSDVFYMEGIFKIKAMKRETLFGTFHEKVYIFNNYKEE